MQRKFALFFLPVPFAGVLYLLSRNHGVWLVILLIFLGAVQTSNFTCAELNSYLRHTAFDSNVEFNSVRCQY